jgi:uncharacterized protein YecT (DUF1311 family)
MLIGILLVVFTLSGCGKDEPDTRTIDSLIEHFKQSGLMMSGRSSKLADVIGATEGAGIEIAGRDVEVFRYDVAKESQKLTLAKIAKEKSISIFSIVAPAKINGGFVMISYDEHPEKEKIIKAFESWSATSAQPSEAKKSPESQQIIAPPPQPQGNDLLKEVIGVWKTRGELGVFKFKLIDDKKYVVIKDANGEETNAAVIVANLDQQNKIISLALEADVKKSFLTLKIEPKPDGGSKFNIKLTLANGQDAELEFVRNIDSTDNLPAAPVIAALKEAIVPAQTSKGSDKVGNNELCADIYKQEEVNAGDNNVMCSNREFERADKELNTAYKAVMVSLAPDRKSALKSEQVAWIKDKEKQCEAATAGTINYRQETLAKNNCLVEMTTQRIAYLKNFR